MLGVVASKMLDSGQQSWIPPQRSKPPPVQAASQTDLPGPLTYGMSSPHEPGSVGCPRPPTA